MATVLGSPLTGLQVNITPDTAASTISWTVTPIAGLSSMPIRSRYATASELSRLAQQSCTAAQTRSTPSTHRYVSCRPAKVVSALSSPIALERTATAGSPSAR
jgi:hypothetical protein